MFGPYSTGSSNWQFKYDVEEVSYSGKEYTFNVHYYLYRPNSESYYYGPVWTFYAWINGTYKQYDYTSSTKKVVPAQQDYWVCTITMTVPVDGYSVTSRQIKVSAGFDSTNGVSPYRSSGGENTITISANASNVKKPQASIYNNGNNTATITLSNIEGGDNNSVSSYYCAYNINEKRYGSFSNTTTKSISLQKGDTQVNITNLYTQGSCGDISYGTNISGKVAFYTRPGPPTVNIEDHGNNTATITCTKGDDGDNNAATGVEVYYTTDGSVPTINSTKYTLGTNINVSSNIKLNVMARTVGTYTGNNKAYYYSDEASVTSDIQSYSKPTSVSGLKIKDNGNNTYSFEAISGKDGGDNNRVTAVEFYFTTDGTTPTATSRCIVKSCSQNESVKVDILDVNTDMMVKVRAVTKGSYYGNSKSYLYSNIAETVSQKILYYQPPIITTPTIIYDKKLTKKSIITINQNVTLYKNTKLNKCTLQLYRDANENITRDDTPLQIKVSNLKFPYTSTSGNYPCEYQYGSEITDKGVTFKVLEDGCVLVNGELQSKDYAQFNLNNNIILTDGTTYYINKDCMLCYRLKENIRPSGDDGFRYESNNSLKWSSDYTFVAAYIQISNNTSSPLKISDKTYKPEIYHEENEWDILGSDLLNISNSLQNQNVQKNINYTLNLKQFQLKSGDIIYIKILYDLQNGAKEDLINYSQLPFSSMHIIESSGVMRVNVNNQWHEGQVWVNIDGIWKEATDVFANTNGQWKESV